jgi:hypothetical protein
MLLRLIRLGCLIVGIVMLSLVVTGVHAQADGQFCVQAFEDRNGNGLRDAAEPLLQSGIATNLLDSNGIVIATALLDESPTASSGVICFQGLEPAQYTIIVTSAEYRATTPDTLTVNIMPGELPPVLDFGAQSVVSTMTEITEVETGVVSETAVERLLFSTFGALVAALIMMVLGLIIFAVRFNRRRTAATATSTSEVPAVPSDAYFRRPTGDTGEYYNYSEEYPDPYQDQR